MGMGTGLYLISCPLSFVYKHCPSRLPAALPESMQPGTRRQAFVCLTLGGCVLGWCARQERGEGSYF
jgi:hypothetical protein